MAIWLLQSYYTIGKNNNLLGGYNMPDNNGMGDDGELNSSPTNKVNSEFQHQKLEALGKFAGEIAHDFNNILSIVSGYTGSAIRKLDKDELKEDDLRKILKAVENGAALTNKLLTFGKVEAGAEEKINLAEALKEVHLLLRPALGNTVKLYMTLPDYPIWVEISKNQITQILLNLAVNARDAMPDGGDLSVVFTSCQDKHVPNFLKKRNPDDEFVRINVTDTGKGISQDAFDKIFDPFFTTKETPEGAGLGLSIVYGIVNHLGGGIEVSSKEGYGSCFSVYIPISEPPKWQNVDTTDISGLAKGDEHTNVRINTLDKEKSLKDKTILIAEDEPELRSLLADMFEHMDMRVLSAENGSDALSVQNEYKDEIDFLLTDVVMPEMDGVKLGELFHDVRPDSEVIYMSGYPFRGERKKNVKIPDDAIFIDKPIEENSIKAVLKRAMERKRERLGED